MRRTVLPALEELALAEHRAWFEGVVGEKWTRAGAYRWLRFESPDPFGALLAAGERLEDEWASQAAAAEAFRERELALLDAAEGVARELGYPG